MAHFGSVPFVNQGEILRSGLFLYQLADGRDRAGVVFPFPGCCELGRSERHVERSGGVADDSVNKTVQGLSFQTIPPKLAPSPLF